MQFYSGQLIHFCSGVDNRVTRNEEILQMSGFGYKLPSAAPTNHDRCSPSFGHANSARLLWGVNLP
jgi:hypothetical protein